MSGGDGPRQFDRRRWLGPGLSSGPGTANRAQADQNNGRQNPPRMQYPRQFEHLPTWQESGDNRLEIGDRDQPADSLGGFYPSRLGAYQ